jgi:uncharacterized protein
MRLGIRTVARRMMRGMNATLACAHPESTARPAGAAFRDGDAVLKAGFQRSVELAGPAGRLEALLNEGAPEAAYAALVCHPHPLGGGTLHNKVVYHAMKVLNGAEWGFRLPVLRFNFRGAGLSQGRHDGEREAEDVEAALDWLETEFKRPIVAAGFSFGAAMTLSACCGRGRARRNIHLLAALGLPTEAAGRGYSYSCAGGCGLPKLFLSGDRDQFAPQGELARVVESAAEPKRLIFIPGTDHFFTGQIAPMQRALANWLKEQIP